MVNFLAMDNIVRSINKDGVSLSVKMLPEIRAMVYREADVRARNYGDAGSGEKRSHGSYLAVVALMHFLRLPAAERKEIYAEMRRVMDARRRLDEEEAVELPPYSHAARSDSPVPDDDDEPAGTLGRSRRPAAGDVEPRRRSGGRG